LVCIGKNEDDLLGVIRASDLLKNPPDLQSIIRPVPIVPESLPLIKLVDWLKNQKTHFALAIDEYGGFSGIVTLNDLATELVGPIRDQYSGDLKEIVKLSDKLWLVSGNVKLSHLAEVTGFEVNETHANSVGGLLTEISDGIPKSGTEYQLSGAKLRVIKADNQGVRLVRLALGVERNSRF
jgi:CBS domain containing-hemolysin-like protein